MYPHIHSYIPTCFTQPVSPSPQTAHFTEMRLSTRAVSEEADAVMRHGTKPQAPAQEAQPCCRLPKATPENRSVSQSPYGGCSPAVRTEEDEHTIHFHHKLEEVNLKKQKPQEKTKKNHPTSQKIQHSEELLYRSACSIVKGSSLSRGRHNFFFFFK